MADDKQTPKDAKQPRRLKKRSIAERLAHGGAGLPPAAPGVRGQSTSSELMVTSKIDRLPSEITPAPLPPSPAADMADVWFEQVPTNPAAIPDLDALSANGNTPAPHIPATAPIRRMPPGVNEGYGYDPRGTRNVGLPRPTWVLPSLIAAICLVVGMLLGALLFGGDSAKSAAPADCECEEPSDKSGDKAGKPDTKPSKPHSKPSKPDSDIIREF